MDQFKINHMTMNDEGVSVDGTVKLRNYFHTEDGEAGKFAHGKEYWMFAEARMDRLADNRFSYTVNCFGVSRTHYGYGPVGAALAAILETLDEMAAAEEARIASVLRDVQYKGAALKTSHRGEE